MTTTDTFSGMNEGKTSSKVICPPGGVSSNIFGDPYDATKDYSLVEKKRQERMAAQDQKLADERRQSQGTQEDMEPQTQHAKAPQTDTQGNLFGASTQPAAGSKPKAVYNPITGELVSGSDGNGDGQTSVKNSSKITNPPGGKSSGLW